MTESIAQEAYAAGWRDGVALAAIRLRAYEKPTAEDVADELAHMVEEGPVSVTTKEIP
jgi:hypothetical protein